MKFTKTNAISGTHLQGNVGATYLELVEIFENRLKSLTSSTTKLMHNGPLNLKTALLQRYTITKTVLII